MIDDVENGKINCVSTKDLSRLGRNYVMTGQYTDFYFPSKGVRYIAINDNVDTLNGESELQLFAGLIKCADCGWSLGYGRRKTKNGYDGYNHCSKNGQGLHQCSMHYIRDDVLCAYVLSRLQYWSQQAQQNEEKLLKRLMGATDRERNAAKKKTGAGYHDSTTP